MGIRRRYRKKSDQFVVAVQLDLDTAGFTYRKWGAEQQCKQGDWIVDNDGNIYSVDAEVFAKTYRKSGDGTYVKTTPIWAEVATQPGSVVTKEGESHYQSGDYLLYNNEDGTDAYCLSAAKFESMYELDE
ncbi:MAG: hypothetical protein JRF56_03190 [Deltaproteobacteria bacterium]|jgi:hypothetical protein|nr:hypothetical protein [Deltaproteobacteria bacterium]